LQINIVSNSDDQNQSDDLAEERPIGVEEQRTIESQERETEPAQTQAEEQLETKEPETTTSVEQVNEILESSKEKQPKARQEDSTRKLFNQFSKHFQISKIASDKTANTLKQIQRQLTQIEKITSIGNKQQVVVKQLTVQVRAMQKQLDRIRGTINRIKIPKKSTNSKKM
jgi:hypothetical protein